MPALTNQSDKASRRACPGIGLAETRATEAESTFSLPVSVAAARESACTDLAANNSCVSDCDLAHDRCGERCAVMASSCGDGEGHVLRATCPSPFFAAECADRLHELSDLLAVVLLNTQRLQWMLPRYSRLKRTVVEVARSAQRSNELLKQWRRRCVGAGQPEQIDSAQPVAPASSLSSWPKSVIDPVEDGGFNSVVSEQLLECAPSAGFDLTAGCDTCTSEGFPKRDDMDGRQFSRR